MPLHKADTAHLVSATGPSAAAAAGRFSTGGMNSGNAGLAASGGSASGVPNMGKRSEGSALAAGQGHSHSDAHNSGGSAHGGSAFTAGAAGPNVNARSSDSGNHLVSGGSASGAPGSPPPPSGLHIKGTTASGHPAAPTSTQSTGSQRGRLQQLGQRLNFVTGLGRKKQTTFADESAAAGGAGGSATAAAGPSSTLMSATSGGDMRGMSASTGGAGVPGGVSPTLNNAEAFNPPNHPVNPFSYLATPFRVMAKTKAGAAMGRYTAAALRLKRDGMPPASYMWLWLGNFKRWHKRYFVASEAPGVLLIYKRANMKGKVWSTSLVDATVAQDDSHPRQIRLETPSGTIFLRVLRPEERQPWLTCLRDSIATYRKHKEVVDTLAAAAGGGGEGEGGHGAVAGALPSVASGAVDQDMEQRRRIRLRVHERLAELAPHVSEVERHMAALGSQLANAAAGFGHLSTPLLPHHSSVAAALSSRGTRVPGGSAEHGHTSAANNISGSGSAADAPAHSPSGPGRQSHNGRGSAGHASLAGVAAQAADREPSQERLGLLARSRSRSRAAAPGAPAATLTGAMTALMEAVRAALHADALRITTLEAENAALNKTLQIVRANANRSGARSRGLSTPGVSGAAGASTARASVAAAAAAAVAGGTTGADDDAMSDGSACTADEDAFDVVEAFDEDDDDGGPFTAHGHYPGTGDEEMEGEDDDEDAEEDAAELAQQAEVLNALEVVRQVEYIAANRNAEHLKNLLAADTPPPPDAEEDEGKGGHKGGKGRGEETDATLGEDEEDDDDDSETALMASTGAAPAGAGALIRAGSTAYDMSGRARVYEGRDRLPAPKPLGRGFSIWSILKNMIGRDLTKITMPATINEPTSMTQRMAEVLENRTLLEKAATTPNSLDRLMLVSCWLLAGYNSQPQRDNKPFNPLLGETFEWVAPDGTARYLCEQVSHHPPVSCFVGEGAGEQGYSLYGEVETKTKFWGKAIECILAGHMEVRLKAWDEEYRFNLGTITINDVILGRFWIDLSCDMKIRNEKTGETSRLVIKPCRGVLKERGKCEGTVYDAFGKEVWKISGSTMVALNAALTPAAAAERGASTEPQLIWTRPLGVPNPTEQYCMSRFALGMNDPADPIVQFLPPTDCRFRPDIRALELGEWNRATSEKLRLEEKQRAARKERKEAGIEYQPKWFKQVMFGTKEATQLATQPGAVWAWTGEYWSAREKKEWGELPDIY
ncbi:hypothetical protein HYH02_003648 [Chlamydomonas schloesseri]|uniref:PH domain-containing protein n=1 Tax=Chlamydomonas schloesseri TaxID=2026947 RepID=A0A835WPV3_9CHLO|nr:hypothetical protein HYH02_003648 [Chlamydomonas schloesseri]|eukprot:KAG2451873.1 hypothetical protein HYH02_003648 [Chlamydomonas schloesseri]